MEFILGILIGILIGMIIIAYISKEVINELSSLVKASRSSLRRAEDKVRYLVQENKELKKLVTDGKSEN